MAQFKKCIAVGTLVAAIMLPATLSVDALTLKEASIDNPAEETPPFPSSTHQMEDVTSGLERAKANGKLALIVLGANWCHDSRALINRFEDSELRQIINDHYEKILIDVGPLQHGKDIIQRFGMPVIYGTPTVLIVDPTTEKQLNRHNMHMWRDAYSIDQGHTNAYFRDMARAEKHVGPKPDTENKTLKNLLAAIDQFEAEQAERIYAGFALIGPMIVMNQEERPKDFADLWNELRDFRYQITEDLDALRKEAHTRAEAGDPNTDLSFPKYKPFSWEQ